MNDRKKESVSIEEYRCEITNFIIEDYYRFHGIEKKEKILILINKIQFYYQTTFKK